jgi:hypothetical protein
MPFYPPNVAGWEAERWLNTGTWLARFNLCAQMIDDTRALKPAHAKPSEPTDPHRLAKQALDFWGAPSVGAATRRALVSYAKAAAVDAASESWEREQYPTLALNALRALVVASPDYQTC